MRQAYDYWQDQPDNYLSLLQSRRSLPRPPGEPWHARSLRLPPSLVDNQLNRTLKFAVTGEHCCPPPAAGHRTHTQFDPRTQQHPSPNLDYITNQFQIALFEFPRAQSAKLRRPDLARSNTFRISTLRGGCPRRSQSCDRLSPQAFPQLSNSLKQIARS